LRSPVLAKWMSPAGAVWAVSRIPDSFSGWFLRLVRPRLRRCG